MEKKNFYQKPETCVIANEYEKPLLSISGRLSDFEENDDEWGDADPGPGGAKDAFFGFEDEDGGWFI